MEKNPALYLEHILDCIIKIKEYTKGINQDDFLTNELIQDATIRNFEIIGEATKQLNSDFRKRYPDIEWKRIAGMRDKLIHDYIGVDMFAVWGVIENILPELEVKIVNIIKIERGDD